MRIQNNMMAMNTHRQYSINNDNTAKAAEKLSSGYRINRAGDDAAGLAISEKMRAQVRGLNMASKNSQDAISLVQTAEGALQEVHSMLQRMNELANQAATGTNEEFDRKAINAEFDQLKGEIDDIANQTTFNNMKLLDGSLGAPKMAVADTSTLAVGKNLATADGNYSIFGNAGATASKAGDFAITIGTYTNGKVETVADAANATHINVEFTDATTGNVTNTAMKISDVLVGDVKNGSSFTLDLGAAGLGSFSIAAADGTGAASKADFLAQLDGTAVTTVASSGSSTSTAASIDTVAMGTSFDTNTDGLASATWTGVNADDFAQFLADNSITVADGAVTVALDFSGSNVGVSINGGAAVDTGVAKPASYAGGGATGSIDLSSIGLGTVAYTQGSGDGSGAVADLESGELGFNYTAASTTPGTPATSAAGGAIKVQVGALEGEQLSISVDKMDVAGLGLTNASISLQEDAGKAITLTRAAINTVSDQRALLGAMQNRLQHKINNLDISAENLNAAESRIRDVDMAKEMTNFTKQNILSQAATAMLAQANSAPQNVLQLLR